MLRCMLTHHVTKQALVTGYLWLVTTQDDKTDRQAITAAGMPGLAPFHHRPTQSAQQHVPCINPIVATPITATCRNISWRLHCVSAQRVLATAVRLSHPSCKLMPEGLTNLL